MSSRVTYTHSVGESLVHIIQPVARQVLVYIIQKLGYLDMFSQDNGGNIDVLSDFTSTSKAVDQNGNAVIRANRVRAKVNPNINPSAVKWEGSGTTIDLGNGNHLQIVNNGARNNPRASWSKETYSDHIFSIMCDTDSSIDMQEHVVGSSITMEVTADFMSPTTAAEFLSRIFSCFHNGDMIGYVPVQYDYPVPEPLMYTLQYLHKLKKMAGLSCLAWLKEKSVCGISTMHNRNKYNADELIVNRNPSEAIYQIECSQEFPAPAQPDGATVNFNVTIQFPRVNRVSLLYPIIVNNQYVDFDYIPTEPEFRLSTINTPNMWQNRAYTEYWKSLQGSANPPVAHYPWWDEWDLPAHSVLKRRGFRAIISVAFTLDDADNEDGETVIDLIDGLPAFRLNNALIKEIQSKRNEVLTPNRALCVAVFADDYQVGSNVQLEDNVKPLLDLSDGRNLHIRCRRSNTVFRLVFCVNDHPVNMTSRPLTYELYSSRFVDVTKAIFSPTKDTIVNEGKQYFYYNEETGKFILIKTTAGESMYTYLSQIPSGILYERTPSQYSADPKAGKNANPASGGSSIPDTYPYGSKFAASGAKFKGRALRAAEPDITEDDIKDDPTKQYPVPTEPVETASALNPYYQESYKGRNVANVFLATITLKRRKGQ